MKFLATFLQPKVSLPTERMCLFPPGLPGFKCNDGECIKALSICDMSASLCKDGSDINFCENMLSCKEPKYKQCPGAKECFIPDLKRRKYFHVDLK